MYRVAPCNFMAASATKGDTPEATFPAVSATKGDVHATFLAASNVDIIDGCVDGNLAFPNYKSGRSSPIHPVSAPQSCSEIL